METRDGTPLQTGTVPYLMTDIEGSTQLVSRLGDAWPRVLDDHFERMRTAVRAHGGTWVSSAATMDPRASGIGGEGPAPDHRSPALP